MKRASFFIRPVRFDEQREGVFTQAVLHVVVQVGFLHAGEGALEAFVVVRFAPRSRDVVRLFGLPFLVFTAHLTVVLRHGGHGEAGCGRMRKESRGICLIGE